MPWTSNRGHYILVLELQKEVEIKVGRLGPFPFRPGIYCYVGRDKSHLKQRLARHCRERKPNRWHIDYLLPHTRMLAVLLFPLEGLTECSLASMLVKEGGIPFPPRFGASDCHCPGHLILLPKERGTAVVDNLSSKGPLPNNHQGI